MTGFWVPIMVPKILQANLFSMSCLRHWHARTVLAELIYDLPRFSATVEACFACHVSAFLFEKISTAGQKATEKVKLKKHFFWVLGKQRRKVNARTASGSERGIRLRAWNDRLEVFWRGLHARLRHGESMDPLSGRVFPVSVLCQLQALFR